MALLLDPEKLGANFLSHDRNAFEWERQGHRLTGGKQVDEGFTNRLEAEIRVTGGEVVAAGFCGLEIEKDRCTRSTTLKQGAFARRVMDKY